MTHKPQTPDLTIAYCRAMHDRLDAPWVMDGPMNRALFDLYVKTQVVPTLQPGDVIILPFDRVPRIDRPLPNRAFQAREGGHGQPVIAQKPWRGSRGEGRRRVVCVFVALQPGSEPC
jgi:hypothetical protein